LSYVIYLTLIIAPRPDWGVPGARRDALDVVDRADRTPAASRAVWPLTARE